MKEIILGLIPNFVIVTKVKMLKIMLIVDIYVNKPEIDILQCNMTDIVVHVSHTLCVISGIYNKRNNKH